MVVNTPDKINILKKRGLDETELNTIKTNYVFLKELLFTLQNVFDTGRAAIPGDKEKSELLTTAFGYDSADELRNKISATLRTNNSLLQKHLGK